jgi:signal transduction histidine kinase
MATNWEPEATATRRGHLRLVRDDVSALLAHDLKTPLAAIAMNLDFALGELGPDADPSVRGALEDCRESNQHAVGIVLDMVDAMQLASGQRRAYLVPLDAQASLAASVRRAAGAAAARGVRVALSAEPTTVHGDADLLDRALERLLERALRHARPGGSVDVTLRHRTIALRVAGTVADPVRYDSDATALSLATHFADAALRAQGGSVSTELDVDGALLFVVALPA